MKVPYTGWYAITPSGLTFIGRELPEFVYVDGSDGETTVYQSSGHSITLPDGTVLPSNRVTSINWDVVENDVPPPGGDSDRLKWRGRFGPAGWRELGHRE